MYKLVLFISLVFIIQSCRKDAITLSKHPSQQFIIIGHAYGNPVDYELSLYKELPAFIKTLNLFVNPVTYVFTGDVVAKPTAENWENILIQFDSLNINDYWIAPGNHDLGSNYFQENIQTNIYFAERIDSNLFFVLNTNFSGWTIDQSQIDLLYSELSDLSGINNIFVFTHQVWWANPKDAVYDIDSIRTNSTNLIEGSHSFWTDAFPMFQSANLPTYFFAGDVGCWDFIPAYVENKHDNFHFYASGVGGGLEDNVLYLKIGESEQVEIERISF
ncbi:MAG: metallophosphoesterase [Putridiphycobacter sp.]|nr:metallophosphoesterase [Putridiphycobacter sp.]